MASTTNLGLTKPAGTADADIGDINDNMDTIDGAFGRNNMYVSLSNVSALPYTYSNTKITAKHRVVNMVLSNTAAQQSDWSYSSSAGSITISGTISGTTNIYLYLAEVY